MASGLVAAGAAEVADGPVLSLISKRLRALRKKHNRILQTEESLAQGKPLNKEQEELLRSKPAVTALIDELEKLRSPLAAALHEELSRCPSPPPQDPSPTPPPPPPLAVAAESNGKAIEDLLALLYFGCLFDIRPQSEFTGMMLTRTHERDCCLTYDYVTDDATDLLGERDLDAISVLGSLVTSRPTYSGVSHKNALQECVQHAKFWLQKSDQPIHSGVSVTYAGLREKLNKIMASDYFTTTPEMKAPVDVAAAVGKYSTTSQVQISETTSPSAQTEGSPTHHQHKEDEQQDFQATEVHPNHQSTPVDEPSKMDEADVLNPSGDIGSAPQEQQKLESDVEEQNQGDPEPKDQQYVPRRVYPNQRGGSRGGGGGGGVGARRGYPNGRGGRGRGGGGGYQNGRSQYYEPGYYPRNYYNSRGRGGRTGGSSMYNSHGGGPHGGHVPANVELGAST